jgi:hypothetical protein
MQTQTKPRPIHTAPKPSHQARELTVEEWAQFGREIAQTYVTMRQGYRLIDQAKQRQNQLLADILSRTGKDGLVEVCSLCNLPHEGAC